MRDALTHRGPDDAGLLRTDHAILAHTRLAVLDPSEAGHQPMILDDPPGTPRFILSYNGEIYNEPEIRRRLLAEGARLHTHCDSETVLHALARWGPAALDRFEGMYALAFCDARDQTLLLARDPLGIKPLYLWRAPVHSHDTIVAASEIPAILACPFVERALDPIALEAYLVTIRTNLADRTLYKGIRTLRPGERLHIDCSGPRLHTTSTVQSLDQPERDLLAADLRERVEAIVAAHLRSDVPLCCLLSGGLDSSIIAAIARRHTDHLHTWCAGARADEPSPDLPVARRVAKALSCEHHEVAITPEQFLARWPQLVARTALPLSTPNEIAIHELARAIRDAGFVVCLSGEGADELFAGYTAALNRCATDPDCTNDLASFMLDSFCWMPRSARNAILNDPHPDAPDAIHDAARAIADACADPTRDDPLLPPLRYLRHLNLPSLLRRLDAMTMHASIESRTPLCTPELARIADALPTRRRFTPASPGKIALREAFADTLPKEVIDRPKASFPLPFQKWIEPFARALPESPSARALFTPAAIATVAQQPAQLWQLAWPMCNFALWADQCLSLEPAPTRRSEPALPAPAPSVHPS